MSTDTDLPGADLPGADPAAADPQAAELVLRARDTLAELTGAPRHDAVVVLGSGWGPAAEALGEPIVEFAMTQLPGFLAPVAEGHRGLVRSVVIAGRRVLVLLGRTHLYEGHGPQVVAHPIRVAAAAGARLAILTNANGSFRDDWPIGTPVLISDHLNLTATSPLTGADFVDLTRVWTPRLRETALALRPELPEGVYALVPGPHYETKAEARAFVTMGADLIGMSTVTEAIAAAALGVQVLGLSVVTALELAPSTIDPDQVVAVAEAAATATGPLIRRLLEVELGG